MNDNYSLLTDSIAIDVIEKYSLNYDPKIVVFYSVNTKLVSLFIVNRIDNNYFKLEYLNGRQSIGLTAEGLALLLIENSTTELEYNVIIDVK